MRKLARLCFGVLGAAPVLAIGLTIALARPAAAHAQLLSTDPVAGGRVATAPTEIRLSFSEGVTVPKNGVEVLNRDRQSMKVTATRVDGTTVVATLDGLTDGGYIVTYRVVSEDSHPISGAFTFAVGATATVPDATAFTAARATRAVGIALGITRGFQYVGLLAFVGFVAVAAWTWALGLARRTIRRAFVAATGVLIVTALAGIALHGANGRAGGVGDAFDPSVWSEALDTNLGTASLARVLLVVAWCFLALSFGRWPRRAWQVSAAAVAIALGATVVMAGHAAAGRWPAVAIGADAVHLAAGALWFGGLLVIVASWPDAAEIARRFSPVALGSVAVLALSGLAQGLRQSGTDFENFTESTYGRLLIVKVVIVIAVVGVARLSRRAVRTGEEGPSSLRRLVGIEVIGMIAILGVTAGLVDAVPPRSRVVAEPVELTRTVGGQTLDVLVDPAKAGPVVLHLTMLQLGTAVTPINSGVQELTASFTSLSGDLGPMAVKMVKAGPAHYISEGLVIPFAGAWKLTVGVRTSDFDQTDEEFTITFR